MYVYVQCVSVVHALLVCSMTAKCDKKAAHAYIPFSLLVSFVLAVVLAIELAQQVDSSTIPPPFTSLDKSSTLPTVLSMMSSRWPACTPPESSKKNVVAVLHPLKQQVPSKQT